MADDRTAPRTATAERRILDAASQLLGARQIEDVTLEDVAVASGLGLADLQRYFPSLERIAARLLNEFIGLVDEHADWLTAPLDADLRSLVERQSRNVASIYARHGAVIAAIADATPRCPEVRALWTSVIETRVRQVADRLTTLAEHGIIRVLDPELVASALVLMVHHTMVRLYRHRSEVPIEESARALFGVWVHAIFPDVTAAA